MVREKSSVFVVRFRFQKLSATSRSGSLTRCFFTFASVSVFSIFLYIYTNLSSAQRRLAEVWHRLLATQIDRQRLNFSWLRSIVCQHVVISAPRLRPIANVEDALFLLCALLKKSGNMLVLFGSLSTF